MPEKMTFRDEVAQHLGVNPNDEEKGRQFKTRMANLIRVQYPLPIPDEVMDITLGLVGIIGMAKSLPLGMLGTMITTLIAEALNTTPFNKTEFMEILPLALDAFTTLRMEDK